MGKIDDLFREYAVAVNAGSGWLFQPETRDYTYVLTARHCIEDGEKNILEKEEIKVYKGNEFNEDNQLKVEDVYVHKEKNKDAAILKVEFIKKTIKSYFTTCWRHDKLTLFGYPDRRRNKSNKTDAVDCTAKLEHVDKRIEIAPDKPQHTLDESAHNTLRGFSGSGVFKEVGANIFLVGINTEMADDSGAGSCALISPLKYFEEIISQYDELSHLRIRVQNVNPPIYQSRIKAFLKEYLGTEEQPRPFEGRSGELADLNKWLNDPGAAPYLFLGADAGLGKSTLLVHWYRQLLDEDQEDLEVLFMPISIRFRTGTTEAVFSTLAAHLATVYGEPVQGDSNTSDERWRDIVFDYLKRKIPTGKRTIIIVDGLDEAVGWEVGPDLFPKNPPKGLRIIASARFTVPEPGIKSWVKKLGWNDSKLAIEYQLKPLSEEAVGDIMARMGVPLNERQDRTQIVHELFRLSQGEPLLIRLFIENLKDKLDSWEHLKLEDLQKIEQGISGWWKHQKSLWGDKYPLKRKDVRTVLNLCVCAVDYLELDDLIEISPAEADLDTWTIDEAIEPLDRILVCTEGKRKRPAYYFKYPRFASFFWERMASSEKKRIESLFINWGERKILDLEEGKIQPEEVSPYLVRHLGIHLERSKADVRFWIRLLMPAWRDACLHWTGDLSGFTSDIGKAFRFCTARDKSEVTKNGTANKLHETILAALCSSSISTRASRISPGFLKRLLKEKIWEPGKAHSYALWSPDSAECLAAILPEMPEEDHDKILTELTNSLRTPRNKKERSWSWEREVYSCLLSLVDQEELKAAVEVAGLLTETYFIEHIARYMKTAGYEKESMQIVEKLPGYERDRMKLFQEALKEPGQCVIDYINGKFHLSDEVLGKLTNNLNEQKKDQIIRICITNYESEKNPEKKRDILERSLRALPSAHFQPYLDPVLDEIKTSKQEIFSISRDIENLANGFSKEQADRVLQMMSESNFDEWDRTKVVQALAVGQARRGHLTEAQKMVDGIEDEYDKTKCLAHIVQYHPEEEQDQLVEKVLNRIKDSSDRSPIYLLDPLLPLLSKQLLLKALDVVDMIGDKAKLFLLAAFGDLESTNMESFFTADKDFMYIPSLALITDEPRRSVLMNEFSRRAQNHTSWTNDELDGLHIVGKISADAVGPVFEKIWRETTRSQDLLKLLQDIRSIGPFMPKEAVRNLPLKELLDTVSGQGKEESAHSLAALFPYIDETARRKTELKGLLKQSTNSWFGSILYTLAPGLNAGELDQVIDHVIRDEKKRTEHIPVLVPRFNSFQRKRVYDWAVTLNVEERTKVTIALLPFLDSESILNEINWLTTKVVPTDIPSTFGDLDLLVNYSFDRNEKLISLLAKYAPKAWFRQLAESMLEDEDRFFWLYPLASHLSNFPADWRLDLIYRVLNPEVNLKREDVLTQLVALRKLILSLGCSESDIRSSFERVIELFP